jgi:hypothetical protein
VLALVIIDTVVVVILAGLVAGLLRSHTDIIRALEKLDQLVGGRTRAAEPASAGPIADSIAEPGAAPAESARNEL